MKLATPSTSTITAGGVSQRALDVRPQRRTLIVQNTGADDLWVSFGDEATAAAPSLLLEPGASLAFLSGDAPTNAVHVLGALGEGFSVWGD